MIPDGDLQWESYLLVLPYIDFAYFKLRTTSRPSSFWVCSLHLHETSSLGTRDTSTLSLSSNHLILLRFFSDMDHLQVALRRGEYLV